MTYLLAFLQGYTYQSRYEYITAKSAAAVKEQSTLLSIRHLSNLWFKLQPVEMPMPNKHVRYKLYFHLLPTLSIKS